MSSPPSHHRPGGGFRNPWPDAEPKGLPNLLRWFAERHTTRRPPPDPDPSVFPRVIPDLGREGRNGALRATWLGHSTVVMECEGCRVLTDPVLGEYASPIRTARLRRWVTAPVTPEELPRIDLVLLSHNHYDHLQAATVRRLAELQPDTTWCAPLGLASLLQRLGVRRVQEFDWWQEREVGAVRVAAVPAQHFSARGVHDRNRTLWCGFTIRIGKRAVYFAGDTARHPEFRRIGEHHGPFDLVLLPVGAYEPRWFMRSVHMNPEEAVQSFAELTAGDGRAVMLPIHWGTFKLTDEPMDEPPRRTRAAWAAAGLAGDRLLLLRHGETRELG